MVGKKNKDMVMSKINEYEAQSRWCSLYVTIRKKNVDGEIVTSYSIERNGSVCSPTDSQPLPVEFTDKDKFVEYVSKTIETLGSQI